MPKRRKRLRKGVESIREQIELHKQKLKAAEKAGNIGLADYYEKEIESMEAALGKKQASWISDLGPGRSREAVFGKHV